MYIWSKYFKILIVLHIFQDNIRDLSENYSGTIIVVTNGFASLAGATVPLITGLAIGNELVNMFNILWLNEIKKIFQMQMIRLDVVYVINNNTLLCVVNKKKDFKND